MINPDQKTISEIIKNLNLEFKHLSNWFEWPPDLFFLTSYLLKRSGAYRSVINNTKWASKDYFKTSAHAGEWLMDIQESITDAKPLTFRPYLQKLMERLDALSNRVAFTELKTLRAKDAVELSYVIVKCHVIADQACGGLGLPGSNPRGKAVVRYLANLLLVNRGSLSTLPKYQGIVIPKMRTPQTGLTLRSFSLHASFHETEVEVMWRTVPWMNKDQNTLNIMCLPWPKEINSKDFTSTRETFQTVRYFKYKDEETSYESHLDKVVKLIKHLGETECDVHIIVLPEMALRKRDYDYFLMKLKSIVSKIDTVPIIISGVREIEHENVDINTVKLATFFAGKWYDFSQTKHHRWKLDRSQLMQYKLPSRLTTERNWYEDIVIEQRRLSFLSPNSWLTLCPLICEDLAQLEPVSEIIRGVGPTLMFALLMDGPQIKERWSARYASIFADDPGTAVLSLTSIGMVKRSGRLEDDGKTNSSSVGLWKDQLRGWRQISLQDQDSVLLMTISSSWKEEFTADGRSDNSMASVFKLDNIKTYQLQDFEDLFADEKTEDLSEQNEDVTNYLGNWLDLRELTTLIYAMETIISTYGDHWDLIVGWLILEEKDRLDDSHPYSGTINSLISAYKDPGSVGIKARRTYGGKASSRQSWPTKSLKHGKVKFVRSWKGTIMAWKEKHDNYLRNNKDLDNLFDFKLDYWEALFEKGKRDLEKLNRQLPDLEMNEFSDEKKDEIRMRKAVPLAVLIALYNRLDEYRAKPIHKDFSRATELFEDLELVIKENNY